MMRIMDAGQPGPKGKPVYVYRRNKLVMTYRSLTEAANSTGIDISTLSVLCRDPELARKEDGTVNIYTYYKRPKEPSWFERMWNKIFN